MLPRLDAAMAAGALSTEFLGELRALAVRHAASRKGRPFVEGAPFVKYSSIQWDNT
jgi:hypothetical protein